MEIAQTVMFMNVRRIRSRQRGKAGRMGCRGEGAVAAMCTQCDSNLQGEKGSTPNAQCPNLQQRGDSGSLLGLLAGGCLCVVPFLFLFFFCCLPCANFHSLCLPSCQVLFSLLEPHTAPGVVAGLIAALRVGVKVLQQLSKLLLPLCCGLNKIEISKIH